MKLFTGEAAIYRAHLVNSSSSSTGSGV